MRHAYPEEFAAFVEEALYQESAAGGLCCKENFAPLFSAAYQASLLREEERPLTFRLALAAPEAFKAVPALVPYSPIVPEHNPHTVRFESMRDLHEGELRRLAPSAKFHRTLIGVCRDPSGVLKIWGLIHTGPGWLRPLQGGRGTAPYFPSVFTLAVSGPGRLVASMAGRPVAKLSGGRISCDAPDIFSSQWLPEIFRGVREEVWALHLQERAAAGYLSSSVDIDIIKTVGQRFIRRILSIARLAHHGGALIIAPPVLAESNELYARIKIKYPLANDEPRRRFRSLVLSIMDELARRETAKIGEKIGSREFLAHVSPGLTLLDDAIGELSNFVAGLAEIDGAVVMTQRWELLGFGAEIAGDLPDVDEVARALDLEGEERSLESTDGVGTRHRSMYRLCRAFPGVLGIVVSQDGGVRFVKWHRGAVTYWEQTAIGALDV